MVSRCVVYPAGWEYLLAIGPMNRHQLIALGVVLANLVLIMLFPPFDYVSLQPGNVPTFAGFDFYFSAHHNRIINNAYLNLEVIVVLLNAAIAWLLLRTKPVPTPAAAKANRLQRGVLWVVAINLVLMVLFPPMENYAAITKAALPSFEGFYFVFGDNSRRQIVTTILYIDIALVLINGGLLWLMFRDRSQKKLTPAEMRALARQIQESQK